MKLWHVSVFGLSLMFLAFTDAEGSSADEEAKPDSNPFFYPKDMPRPPQMWIEGFASRLHAGPIQKYETPIQVWQTWRLDQAMWNCVAAYHPTALDALTKTRPVVSTPSTAHTSEARALCMIFAVNKLVPDLVPIANDTISAWLDEIGLESRILSNKEARSLAGAGSAAPRVIGSIVAAAILDDMLVDGWNYKGARTSAGNCSANCFPFSDTSGYIPKNTPWELRDSKSWQPPIETDQRGFFFSQVHVTPHIGTAKPVILTPAEVAARVTDDPQYDYDQEVKLTLDRVAALAKQPFWQDMVPFMDNKINIAGGMIMRLRAEYNLSLEAQLFYHYGYTSAELDVVILVWKEKVRWDLVRPTSLIRALGEAQVSSFAGQHFARDWTPFIRVMPHSEYPSGSSCICTAVAEFIDAFLTAEYGADSIATTWDFPKVGSHTFGNMAELARTCGESRLRGGMHFTTSVSASRKLCDGVGKMSYSRLMTSLLGDGIYSELMASDKEKPF